MNNELKDHRSEAGSPIRRQLFELSKANRKNGTKVDTYAR